MASSNRVYGQADSFDPLRETDEEHESIATSADNSRHGSQAKASLVTPQNSSQAVHTPQKPPLWQPKFKQLGFSSYTEYQNSLVGQKQAPTPPNSNDDKADRQKSQEAIESVTPTPNPQTRPSHALEKPGLGSKLRDRFMSRPKQQHGSRVSNLKPEGGRTVNSSRGPPDLIIGKNTGKKGFSLASGAEGRLPGARTAEGRGIRFRDQNQGEIYWHKEIYEVKGRVPTKSEAIITHDVKNDRYIVEKPRCYVIIHRTLTRVTEIPIGTRSGRGSAGLKECQKKEYMTLVPHGKTREQTENQNPPHPMLRMKMVCSPDDVNRPNQMVHISDARTRDVDKYELKRVAALYQEDIVEMMRLYHAYQKKPDFEDEP